MLTLATLEHKKKKKEPFTRDDLVFLYEVNSFTGGTGEFSDENDPRFAALLEDRNKEEDMLTIFECTKDQIAHVPSEIAENTKAYVGQLEPGIIQKLPETLTYVFTSFPGYRIRRESIEIGGKSKEQLISEMEASGINIADNAKSMMENPDFITGTSREEAKLVLLTVEDLGFETGALADEIYKRAQTLGLEQCPSDTGPNYVLQHKVQPPATPANIAMKYIKDSDGIPRIFEVSGYEGDLWMGGAWAVPDTEWPPYAEFMFRLSKS